MLAPTRGSNTKTSSIEVLWSSLTLRDDIRANNVLSYNLQWDKGTNGVTWEDLVGYNTETTSTSFNAVTGIIGGQLYQFKVRAKNLYGWGSFSPVTTIRASQFPDPVATITTANALTDVLISWTAPDDNFESVTSYSLQVLDNTGLQYHDANSYCTEDAATILANRLCTISMAELRAAPFSLTFNKVVVARVKSTNQFGTSDYSQPNILGANVKTEPQQV